MYNELLFRVSFAFLSSKLIKAKVFLVRVLRVSNLKIVTVGWNFQGLVLRHSGSKPSPGPKKISTGSGANLINYSQGVRIRV